ncbi:DNA-binding transcriptional MerR regulator [Psychromicrobium silvestre]|uniref:DNA-binding transcriptional MerR regulator n=1 Tax=Psychromicrobium silvestre TaxID=1645614 RepID=A0A7Y9S861_9MICC|nr:MerR family transcriptional regulator [Psychromicrobium silvestre]NYE95646.1 DNA-binding transcriptional MerR regulator [Psychromicrobium silvestre]
MSTGIQPNSAAAAGPRTLSISDVSATTGLSQDTLRWYEREGMFPQIARGGDRRRKYDETDLARIMMLVKLRRTGMSVHDMQRFVQLLAGGRETHQERMTLLLEHRIKVLAQLKQVQDDLETVDLKISHYETLIALDQDCLDPTESKES